MTANIDLGKVIIEASQDPFHAARGQAIQSYASLEQSLCSIFANFASIKEDVAAIIFFKITSAGARDAILEKLLKKQHGTKYSIFWNSVTSLIRQITQERNEIVHWNVNIDIGDVGAEVVLRPPTFWEPNSPVKTIANLNDFRVKCSFIGRLCNMFRSFLTPEHAALLKGQQHPWTEIFQQPVVYPPPSTHPLCQTTPTPENQPPPPPA
jgi:hypothetical protein